MEEPRASASALFLDKQLSGITLHSFIISRQTPAYIYLTSEQTVKSTSPNPIRALILDMDGVLWRDNQPIGNLPLIFDQIAQLGWKVTLATNNATRSVEQYQEKLRNFKVEIQSSQIITSGEATAHYLHKRYPAGGNVYVIGEAGLEQTLRKYGFQIHDRDVQAVVVSYDRQLTYEKLKKAALLIRAGAPLIATNPDLTLPTPEGLVPGAGAILAAVVAATQTNPIVIGKPEPEMYRVAIERMQATPETTLVVGDRLETDIAGAQKLGCRTALVLSGAATLQAAKAWQPKPDWIVENLSSLIDQLQAATVNG